MLFGISGEVLEPIPCGYQWMTIFSGKNKRILVITILYNILSALITAVSCNEKLKVD
jgi:hypothetical protein